MRKANWGKDMLEYDIPLHVMCLLECISPRFSFGTNKTYSDPTEKCWATYMYCMHAEQRLSI